MRLIELFQKELISLAFALATALVFWFFRSRTILYWSRAHSFTFWIQPVAPPPSADGTQLPAPPSFTIETASFLFTNAGRSGATNIELTFNWRPDNFQVWPVRPFNTVLSADNRFTLQFSSLAPKENFQVEVLSTKMPVLLNVRCSETVGAFLMHAAALQGRRFFWRKTFKLVAV
jgi:hypothetical protein